MKGWKTVKRTFSDVSLVDVVAYFETKNFQISYEGEVHTEMQREGTAMTLSIDKIGVDLIVIKDADDVQVFAKYTQLVVTDTNDLIKFLDKCADEID